jgi:hypothetical protein
LRASNADTILEIEAVLSRYRLTRLQKFVLAEWAAGRFTSDWAGMPQPAANVTAAGMTAAALQATVGQGFFPGIEAGIITTDPTIYSQPFDFRLDHATVRPGDLTALMALPWQADFWDCRGGWWPSQRPDQVLTSAGSAARRAWARGADGYLKMVHNFPKLAFITAQKDPAGNVVLAEDQRSPDNLFA